MESILKILGVFIYFCISIETSHCTETVAADISHVAEESSHDFQTQDFDISHWQNSRFFPHPKHESTKDDHAAFQFQNFPGLQGESNNEPNDLYFPLNSETESPVQILPALRENDESPHSFEPLELSRSTSRKKLPKMTYITESNQTMNQTFQNASLNPPEDVHLPHVPFLTSSPSSDLFSVNSTEKQMTNQNEDVALSLLPVSTSENNRNDTTLLKETNETESDIFALDTNSNLRYKVTEQTTNDNTEAPVTEHSFFPFSNSFLNMLNHRLRNISSSVYDIFIGSHNSNPQSSTPQVTPTEPMSFTKNIDEELTDRPFTVSSQFQTNDPLVSMNSNELSNPSTSSPDSKKQDFNFFENIPETDEASHGSTFTLPPFVTVTKDNIPVASDHFVSYSPTISPKILFVPKDVSLAINLDVKNVSAKIIPAPSNSSDFSVNLSVQNRTNVAPEDEQESRDANGAKDFVFTPVSEASTELSVDDDSEHSTISETTTRAMTNLLGFRFFKEDNSRLSNDTKGQLSELYDVDVESKTPPIFVNAPYEAILPINASENMVLFSGIIVTGLSSGNVDLECVSYKQFEDLCDYFTINTNNVTEDSLYGSLVLAKDFSGTENFYQLKLIALAELTNATTTITIIVQKAQKEDNVTEDNPEQNSEDDFKFLGLSSENHAPKFSSENISIMIDENLIPGSLVQNFDLNVTDEDWGYDAIFSLDILDPSGLFIIEPAQVEKNSKVFLRLHPEGSLDYEKPEEREIVFLILAKETRNKLPLSSRITVTVTVVDVNDNSPEFAHKMYNVSLPESVPVGTEVIAVNATDRDSGVFGTEGIVYSLEGIHQEKFHVDPLTGVVTVAACNFRGTINCLDFEEQESLTILVRASDENGKGRSTVTVLEVDLLDVNDNPPRFTKTEYDASYRLGDDVLSPPLFVKAVDADVSSSIQYSILTESIKAFYINASSGEIRFIGGIRILNQQLDNNTVTLIVKASDENDYYDTAFVIITILADNNNAPEFLYPYYNATVPDSAKPGDFVTQLAASDNDFASNAEVSYIIQYGGKGNFVIDPHAGIVSIASRAVLDYEKQREYHLHIAAVDNGSPALAGTTQLTITITDANSKPPVFSPKLQTAQVKSSASKGQLIYQLHANDSDAASETSLHYIIAYPVEIINKEGLRSNMLEEKFTLDELSGELRVASALERDAGNIFILMVQALDTSAEPVQTSIGTLVITIADDSNHHPYLNFGDAKNSTLILNTVEEVPVGTLLYSFLKPEVADVNLTYSIKIPSQFIELDQTTGILKVASRIDYEQIQNFSFVVVHQVEQFQNRVSETHVTVNVININDNYPVFSENEYYFTVEENSPAGHFVGKIFVTDNDLEEFGTLSLMLDTKYASHFDLSNDGVLVVSSYAEIDREIIDKFSFEVIATDLDSNPHTRKTATTSISVTVLDVNDNPPEFLSKTYEAVVSPTTSIGSPILRVEGVDKDFGINSSLLYSINGGNNEGVFWINETSGLIHLGSQLLTHVNKYVLHVVCRDENGKGLQTDECVVMIDVLGINVTPPKFVLPLSNETDFFVEENLPGNLLLTTVKAEDRENSNVRYFFQKNNSLLEEFENFSINSITGELNVKGPLDRETKEKYQLLLVAKDNGSPSLQTVRLLNIFVTDVDDNIPTFPSDPFFHPYSFSVNENEPTNTVVGQVTAFDADTASNGKIYYHIIDGNEDEAFSVELFTGIIRTHVLLDFENKSEYRLQIAASSNKDVAPFHRQIRSHSIDTKNENVSLDNPRSIATVQVTVNNVNDNIPLFIGTPYQTGVKYSANIGDFVTQVKAIDSDGDNITYSLLSCYLYRSKVRQPAGAVVPYPFSVDQSGRIYTAGVLNSYNQDRFLLTVAAQENSSPFHIAKAVVEIWVYEISELMRVVVARSPEDVTRNLPTFIEALSNLTKGNVYIDDIRYHITKQKEIDTEGTDLYIHVIDPNIFSIKSTDDVLDVADSTMFLSPDFQSLRLTSLEPVVTTLEEKSFNPALAALIAVLIVLFFGIIILVIICCSSRYWIDYKKMKIARNSEVTPVISSSQLLSSNNPSFSSYRENPLWIDQRKIKQPYEEQELSIQVLPDFLQRSQRNKPSHKSDIETQQSDRGSYFGSLTSTTVLEAKLNFGDDLATFKDDDIDMAKKSNHKMDLEPGLSTSSAKSEITQKARPVLQKSDFTNSTDPAEPHFLQVNEQGEPVMVGDLL